MFNKKLKKIQKEIYGEESEYVMPLFFGEGEFTKSHTGLLKQAESLRDRVQKLEAQNNKLQALLNEVIDYVYSEKKV